MNNLTEKDYFEKVDVNDELPEHDDSCYVVIPFTDNIYPAIYNSETKEFGCGAKGTVSVKQINDWIKPTKGILIQKEELIELLTECWHTSKKVLPYYSLDKFLEAKGIVTNETTK